MARNRIAQLMIASCPTERQARRVRRGEDPTLYSYQRVYGALVVRPKRITRPKGRRPRVKARSPRGI
jgi:hypothetical protein